MTLLHNQKLTHTEYMRLWRGRFNRQRAYIKRPELRRYRYNTPEYKKAWRELIKPNQ